MIYDIRNISLYVPIIHSRYYIDTNACVYTSISGDNSRILVNGVRYNISGFKKSNIHFLNRNDNMLIPFPQATNYFLMYDGSFLKRLSTRINNKNEVDVCLTTINGRDKGDRFSLHRLMGYVFLGLKQEEEIHHIDQNRVNNKLDNLRVMSKEEHRGQGNYLNNHKLITPVSTISEAGE